MLRQAIKGTATVQQQAQQAMQQAQQVAQQAQHQAQAAAACTADHAAVNMQLQGLLEEGLITPIQSPPAAPVLFVKLRADGKLRCSVHVP